eukprot:4415276-Prymnesium_polylepis.1
MACARHGGESRGCRAARHGAREEMRGPLRTSADGVRARCDVHPQCARADGPEGLQAHRESIAGAFALEGVCDGMSSAEEER